jgi:hypothetical protein
LSRWAVREEEAFHQSLLGFLEEECHREEDVEQVAEEEEAQRPTFSIICLEEEECKEGE